MLDLVRVSRCPPPLDRRFYDGSFSVDGESGARLGVFDYLCFGPACTYMLVWIMFSSINHFLSLLFKYYHLMIQRTAVIGG